MVGFETQPETVSFAHWEFLNEEGWAKMAKLYFRYGAMNCGKSAQLLQVAHNYDEKGMKILLIKAQLDTKGDDKIVSRTGIARKVDFLVDENQSIKDLVDALDDKVAAILVDEAQFLTRAQVDELYSLTKPIHPESHKIPVICYGLRGDFMTELFEGSARLLALADAIEELKTICACGKKATLNMRFRDGVPIFEGAQVEIEGDKAPITYSSACGECYLRIKNEQTKKA